MARSQPAPADAVWPAATLALTTAAAATALVAVFHMLDTAQRGAICGATSAAALGHCWACYAAPLLALAALAAWRTAGLRRSLVRARSR